MGTRELFDVYAREIRRVGECFLLADGETRRIVPVSSIRVGAAGLVVDGVLLPESATLSRLFRPHPRYRALPEARPDASDVEVERWFRDDMRRAAA